jgi:hypothetical protein
MSRLAVFGVLVLGLLALGLLGSTEASARVRSCGDIHETSRHLAIINVTTRRLSCNRGRKDAVELYSCSTKECVAGGRSFQCTNLGQGESVDERCVAGKVVVRFQTGV